MAQCCIRVVTKKKKKKNIAGDTNYFGFADYGVSLVRSEGGKRTKQVHQKLCK